MAKTPRPPPPKTLDRDRREARLAEALRANLKRRKAAARVPPGGASASRKGDDGAR